MVHNELTARIRPCARRRPRSDPSARRTMDINPYQSPQASQPPPAAVNRSTLGGVTVVFTVHTPAPRHEAAEGLGVQDAHGGLEACPTTPHVVEIYYSRWSGL